MNSPRKPSEGSECTVVIGEYGSPCKVVFVEQTATHVVLSWPSQDVISYPKDTVRFV